MAVSLFLLLFLQIQAQLIESQSPPFCISQTDNENCDCGSSMCESNNEICRSAEHISSDEKSLDISTYSTKCYNQQHTNCLYQSINTGFCSSILLDRSECENVAIKLYKRRDTIRAKSENDPGSPPGCYENEKNGELYFNTAKTSETPCSSNRPCKGKTAAINTTHILNNKHIT